jgi:DNA-binding response OmpR family regulator
MNGKPNLLIIEDDDLTRAMYKVILEKEFNLTICGNVEDFYAKLKIDNYEIFLVDLALSDYKSGIDLIRELRAIEKYKFTPIIVLTAYAQKKDEDASLKVGATEFIRKPIDNKVLIDKMKKYF